MKKGNNTGERWEEGGRWEWGGETYAALLAFHRASLSQSGAVNDARQRIEKSELTKLYTIFCLFNFDGCWQAERGRRVDGERGVEEGVWQHGGCC